MTCDMGTAESVLKIAGLRNAVNIIKLIIYLKFKLIRNTRCYVLLDDREFRCLFNFFRPANLASKVSLATKVFMTRECIGAHPYDKKGRLGLERGSVDHT